MQRMALALSLGGFALAGGCKSWLFDPGEVGRGDRSDRMLVPILKSVDPLDEDEAQFSGAQDVKADDLKVFATDYVVGPNDVITVSIFDLVMKDVEFVRTSKVSETGMLSLPQISDPVQAAGLTEQELTTAVATKFKEKGLLNNPNVTVTVVEARGRTFNIMGVPRGGQYAIPKSDFRILNAMVLGGDVQVPTEYIYVIRKLSSDKPSAQPAAEQKQSPATQPAGDILAPRGQANGHLSPMLAMMQATDAPPAPTTAPVNGDEKYIMVDGKPVLMGATQPAVAAEPAAQPAVAPAVEPAVAQPAYEFGAAKSEADETRVIRVPLQQLLNGDLRYNIVVRPDDILIVPQVTQQLYYLGGHFGSPGVFSMTGQKVTLKQAIAGARMLDPNAVQYRTDLIRRVGNNEIWVRLDLEKIFEGKQPDIFLKANDLVMVGTDFYVPFLQAVRGAFRMTYGFGFLYDRNYAPQQSLQN